ncbi:phosphohydrolase [Candidatus Parcubacteria bacterium]|nr:phosphohydrolase [Candidatus Parcubacteria bacterium]
MSDPTNKNIVVLYHAECTDGFSGAWAAWKKFGDSAAYIPVYHNVAPPAGLSNKEIYMVDFTYPEEVITALAASNKRVTAIDHHVSVEAATRSTQDFLFDNNHSGAVLAWKYFHPEQPVPRLLTYVEDMDLWRWRDPDSGPITMALTALETYNFKTWDGISQDLENPEFRHQYITQGNLLIRFQDREIETLIKGVQLVECNGHKVFAVNAPHILASRIGNDLAKMSGLFGIVWSQEKDRIFVSLRSIQGDNSFDVAELATQFGGGGHKNSAGFSFSADKPFPWKIIHE